MKLLSTIAFLLLTFSAFSQEKLSYQDGIIMQGEEVLSLYELSVLVNGANITYTKGLSTRHFKFDAEKTERLRLAGDDKKLARALSAKAAVGAAAGFTIGIQLVLAGPLLILLSTEDLNIFFALDPYNPFLVVARGSVISVLGVGLLRNARSSAAKIGTSESFGQRAEESIYKAVKLYNASLLEAQ